MDYCYQIVGEDENGLSIVRRPDGSEWVYDVPYSVIEAGAQILCIDDSQLWVMPPKGVQAR